MTLHDCPIPECKVKLRYSKLEVRLRHNKLMCPKHCKMVTAELAEAVRLTWRQGSEAEYFTARRAAIASVCELLGYRVCRVCRCSERDACNPPCGWVYADLCRTCANARALDGLQTFNRALSKFVVDLGARKS